MLNCDSRFAHELRKRCLTLPKGNCKVFQWKQENFSPLAIMTSQKDGIDYLKTQKTKRGGDYSLHKTKVLFKNPPRILTAVEKF